MTPEIALTCSNDVCFASCNRNYAYSEDDIPEEFGDEPRVQNVFKDMSLSLFSRVPHFPSLTIA